MSHPTYEQNDAEALPEHVERVAGKLKGLPVCIGCQHHLLPEGATGSCDVCRLLTRVVQLEQAVCALREQLRTAGYHPQLDGLQVGSGVEP